uniref:Uncharacterized protein n=1 Tax=Setaria italica TaxID=4555 RepID=K3YNN3_SETIT
MPINCFCLSSNKVASEQIRSTPQRKSLVPFSIDISVPRVPLGIGGALYSAASQQLTWLVRAQEKHRCGLHYWW